MSRIEYGYCYCGRVSACTVTTTRGAGRRGGRCRGTEGDDGGGRKGPRATPSFNVTKFVRPREIHQYSATSPHFFPTTPFLTTCTPEIPFFQISARHRFIMLGVMEPNPRNHHFMPPLQHLKTHCKANWRAEGASKSPSGQAHPCSSFKHFL